MTARVSFNIAQCYALLGLFEEAVFYYSQAIALDAYLAVSYFCRANCYFRGRDFFQAAMDLSLVLEVFSFFR